MRVLTSIGMLLILFQLQGCATGVAIGAAAAAGSIVASAVNDRRDPNIQSRDSEISMSLRQQLSQDPSIGGWSDSIEVTTYNLVVLITGQAPNDIVRQHVVTMARKMPNIRGVYDKLHIPGPGVVTMTPESDLWLATKVRSALIATEGVNATLSKLKINNGVIYMLGMLTRAEAQGVVDVVRRVDGVRKVVPLFEYVRIVDAPTS
ncbi:MAG: BON domain-containing protein [Pseudomonadota bacterium]